MQFPHLKAHKFLYYPQSCATIIVYFRIFSSAQKDCLYILYAIPHNLSAPAQATTNALTVPTDLPTLDISHTWSPTTRGLAWLAFPQGILLSKTISRSFLPMADWQSILRTDHLWLYIHAWMEMWVLQLLFQECLVYHGSWPLCMKFKVNFSIYEIGCWGFDGFAVNL